jgi:anti-sigma-K factor RskA
MNSIAHSECREMLAQHALTALDAQQVQTMTSHLETCTDCRAELEKWQETASLLALVAQPTEPPPEVRSRILRELNKSGANDRTMHQSGQNVVEMRPIQAIGSWLSWQALTAAATLLALGLALFLLWRENTRNQQELARLSTEIEQTNQQLRRDRELIGILTSPGVRRALLSGTSVAPSARATIAYDPSGQAILLATGLPPAPAGKAYQLWFIVGKQPLPGKLFSPRGTGEGFLSDHVPAAALDAAVFAVTLEPENGGNTPTGAIYLSSAS